MFGFDTTLDSILSGGTILVIAYLLVKIFLVTRPTQNNQPAASAPDKPKPPLGVELRDRISELRNNGHPCSSALETARAEFGNKVAVDEIATAAVWAGYSVRQVVHAILEQSPEIDPEDRMARVILAFPREEDSLELATAELLEQNWCDPGLLLWAINQYARATFAQSIVFTGLEDQPELVAKLASKVGGVEILAVYFDLRDMDIDLDKAAAIARAAGASWGDILLAEHGHSEFEFPVDAGDIFATLRSLGASDIEILEAIAEAVLTENYAVLAEAALDNDVPLEDLIAFLRSRPDAEGFWDHFLEADDVEMDAVDVANILYHLLPPEDRLPVAAAETPAATTDDGPPIPAPL